MIFLGEAHVRTVELYIGQHKNVKLPLTALCLHTNPCILVLKTEFNFKTTSHQRPYLKSNGSNEERLVERTVNVTK